MGKLPSEIASPTSTSEDELVDDEHKLPSILTVDELAEYLRVNRKTIYEAIRVGEIPGVRRIGRCLRIHRDTVLEWLIAGKCVSCS